MGHRQRHSLREIMNSTIINRNPDLHDIPPVEVTQVRPTQTIKSPEYTAEILKNVLENTNLSDFALIAEQDGQRFEVCRAILAASSDYFKAMFESDFADSKNKDHIVTGMNGATLQRFIGGIYSGYIELDDDCAHDIITVANFLRFPHIEKKCVEYLENTLSCENCVSHYKLADRISCTNLAATSVRMICKSFRQISSAQLLQMNATLLLEVLRSDQIKAPEEMVFNKLKEWVETNEEERSKHVEELMKCIQLERIDGKFLLNPIEVFCQKHGCERMVIDEYRKQAVDRPATRASQRCS